jgi:hypothetical protein
VRRETLDRLDALADEVSRIVRHRVEPLQVAAILIERELDTLDDKRLAGAVARARRYRYRLS